MITSNRDVKIMDFGIAQIPTGSRTQLGTVLGSPKYMAPEQVAGQATDGKTDIFALGVVLYEMLTGTTPFNGDNLSAIMYKILNEEPAPPSTINPRVPPVFDRIVSRALAKRPEDRYQTAREFARDLRNQDAVLPQAGRHPAVSNKPANTGQASKTPAGQHDATIFLPPHQARGVIAAASVVSGPGIKEKIVSALRHAPLSRKFLLFAVPMLAIAAFVIYSQPPQSRRDSAPVLEDTRVTAPQPAVEPATGIASPGAEPQALAVPVVPSSKTATSSAPVALEKATVSFAISPWGEVFVDGKSVGVSPPLSMLQLESGKHTVEVRNQAFAPYRDTVNLKPGQSLKIRHKFR